jgi:type VI secretion system secreted protein Hcp
MAIQDFFLKIEGIDGEAQDKSHKNEIEIDSWSWGATNAGTAVKGGGMGAGKVAVHDIDFVKGTDKASAKLMLACAQGQHIKSAVLTCRKAGKEQQEYLKLTFSDVMISGFQTGGSSGDAVGAAGTQAPGSNPAKPEALSYSFGGRQPSARPVGPIESFSLNFTKIEYEYKQQKPDGTLAGAIKTSYDIKQQQGS